MKVTQDHTAQKWRWALNRSQMLSSVCFILGFLPEHVGSIAQGARQTCRFLGSQPRFWNQHPGVGGSGEAGIQVEVIVPEPPSAACPWPLLVSSPAHRLLCPSDPHTSLSLLCTESSGSWPVAVISSTVT